jgi:hypothetical protein
MVDFRKKSSDASDSRVLLTYNVDFYLRIEKENFEYHQYADVLYREAAKKLKTPYYGDKQIFFSPFSYESPISLLLKEKTENVLKKDSSFVLFTSYKESEGSFIIGFSFFLLNCLSNYGGIRESLDYLKNDIDLFLNNSFDHVAKVNVSYIVNEHPISKGINEGLTKLNEKVFFKLFKELKNFKRVALISISLILIFGMYLFYNIDLLSSSKIDKDEATEMIQKEIEKYKSQKAQEEILNEIKDLNKNIKDLEKQVNSK